MDTVTFTLVIEATIDYKFPIQSPPKIALVSNPQIEEEKEFGPQYSTRFMDITAYAMASLFQQLRMGGGAPAEKAKKYFLHKLDEIDKVQNDSYERLRKQKPN